MKTPILGSSYVARSVNAADSRMVNLFPEMVPEGGKEPAFLSRAPGLRRVATIGTGPIRGMWALGRDYYVVSGDGFYRVNGGDVPVLRGTIQGVTPVVMTDNGTQIFIAANPYGYIYNTATDVFSRITDPDFPGANSVGFLDGYFVFTEAGSQRVWVTSLLDGTSVDPLDFASAEGNPDNLVGLIIDHREAWLFGTNSTEVWYNAGLTDFPLVRVQGAFNEIGCAATYSIAKMNNQVYWLGQDARGFGIVYQANGYTGQRISTHAVEWQIQEYGVISDAIAYTYQQDGHSFYVLTFPSAGATWVYDAVTGAWHERLGWDNGDWVRYRPNAQVQFNRQTLLGDYETGDIYVYDLETYTYAEAPQRWVRSWRALPTGENTLRRTTQHALQLDCETGVGLPRTPAYEAEDIGTESLVSLTTETGATLVTLNIPATPGYDPQVMLRWSDDGGHTWSNERWQSMGQIGRFGRRTIWRRLGMTLKLRDRVYEISGTDPVKIAIMGAELQISGTNA